VGRARMEKGGREKERLARPGSASSLVSAHCHIGIGNSFFPIFFTIDKLT
jgi:hypothetical protein